jgi:dihydrofolate synthase/folylpolyglutamate synthase
MFSSSSEFFSWLSRFINYESGLPPKKSFRLDRMEILAELAGNPERCAPCIHIAGSKGKGSVTGMVSSILEAGGFRAARYMSPHVSDFRERIGLGNSFFDEGVYCAAGEELRLLAEKKIPAAKISLFDPANEEGEAPTFFELLTLFFFLCAKIGKCDAMVVETGMGGRLDCTNIVGPVASVITLIELEHTAILGKTIAAIAFEKAGIIKPGIPGLPGKPVVLAAQPPEALEVFRKKAAETKSPLYYFPQIAAIENLRITNGGTDFSLAIHENSQWAKPLQLFIPIPGKVQAENASLAAVAAKVFGPIDDKAITEGLLNIKIPARFEKISENPPVIIDGAHTPESVSLCAGTFCSLHGEGGLLLFGCAADKDASAMAGLLLPHFSAVIITTPGAFRMSNPEKVYQVFSSGKTIFVKDTSQAIQQALELARNKNLPVLCTGSFYLASEIRNYILGPKA